MNYSLKIDFSTDRPLTEDELDTLLVFCITQVNEPQVDNDEGFGYSDADYSTDISLSSIGPRV
jgi:hypothetical protein